MKTLRDLESMKKQECTPFGSAYEYYLLMLEDSYLSKMDGIQRIKSFLQEWNLDAREQIIYKLIEMLEKEPIDFCADNFKNELLSD